MTAPFLIDTGADSTSLSPRDWRLGGLVALQFATPSVTITGYGGNIECALEPAELIMEHDTGTRDLWRMYIEIAPESITGNVIPSILGRDVLADYRLVCSPRDDELTLESRR